MLIAVGDIPANYQCKKMNEESPPSRYYCSVVICKASVGLVDTCLAFRGSGACSTVHSTYMLP